MKEYQHALDSSPRFKAARATSQRQGQAFEGYPLRQKTSWPRAILGLVLFLGFIYGLVRLG